MSAYRNDPMWAAAQREYLRDDGTADQKLVRSIKAAISMLLAEQGDRDTAALLLRPSA